MELLLRNPQNKKNEESDASFPPAAPLEKPSTQQRRPTHSTKAKCAAAAAASAKSRCLCGKLVYFFFACWCECAVPARRAEMFLAAVTAL